MKLHKRISFFAARIFPTTLLNQIGSTPILLPYHHTVSNEYLPHIKGMYGYKNCIQFEKDLDWLLKYRTPISPEEIGKNLTEGRPLPANTFLLTFDDGLREVYDIVAPLLQKKGVPAIFFINPSFLDNKELFYRCKLSLLLEKIKNPQNSGLMRSISEHLNFPTTSFTALRERILQIHYPDRHQADELGRIAEIDFDSFLANQRPFLTREQVRALHQKGFTIGGHSMDHPHYKFLNETDQLLQTRSSLMEVNELAPSKQKYFSFPHQDHTIRQSFFNAILQEFPDLILFGTQNQKDEAINKTLHRFNGENPEIKLESMAKAVMLYTAINGKMKKNSIIRH